MKNLIILFTLIASISLHARTPDIQCAKLKRWVRPVSKDAIILANHLKVKTCSGERFQYEVKKLKTTVKMVKPTKDQVERYGLSKSGKSIDLNSLFN